MRKLKPKKDIGYYCDLCGLFICKYVMDLKGTGVIYIKVPDSLQEKHVCRDCAKEIAEEIIDDY